MILRRILYLILLTAFLSTYSFTMPLSPESVEHLRATGQLETVLDQMAEARERGVNAPGENILRSMRELRRDDPNEVTLRVPVILVDFEDNQADEDEYPVEHFEDMLFSLDDFDGGSMREWYRENSYDEVDVIGEVVGWVRLEEEYAYYVGERHGMGEWPNNSQRMTWEAVQAVNDDVDFSEFDNNDDGHLDALYVVHAGPGAEANNGDEDMIWSHAWALNNRRIRLDGVIINRYNTVTEDGKIGVFGHELGHNLFGLPDTYDRDYSSSGLGSWCMMAAGSWNGEEPGTSPAHFSLPLKAFLEFVEPNLVEENIFDLEIDPIVDEGETYMFLTEREDELFMAENRQRIGFDEALPGSGLLIYHVDQNVETQNDNEWYPDIDEEDGHYLLALEQADGNWDLETNENRGDEGDPYPFERNNSFNGETTPNSDRYSGDETEIAINNIAVERGVVTCDLLIEEDNRAPEINVAPLVIETSESGDYAVEISNVGDLQLVWRAGVEEQQEIPEWISWEPDEGVLEPDEMEELTITLDAEGLDPDEYGFGLHIRSNDRENNDIGIAILLVVEEVVEHHFQGWVETESNHSIIIRELTLDEEIVPSGWDIGVFTPDGALAGGELWDAEEGTGIAAWESDEDVDQFDDGEVMSFRVWDPESETESRADVTEIVMGNLEWEANGLTVLELAVFVVRSPWDADDYVETDTNHSVLIMELTFDDEVCPSGWDIAVFAPHPDGELTLSGSELWNADDGSGLAAWGAADEAPNQFEDGDEMTFMVWDFEADMVFDARPDIFNGGIEWEADGLTVMALAASSAPPDHEIVISFRQGWNIMSINVLLGEDFYEEEEDEGPSVVLMMEQLRIDEDNHHVILMKNQRGNFYVPNIPFNNIPFYEVAQGYQIKLDEDVETSWTAPPVDADADIPLRRGWNIIAYFPQYDLDMSSPDFYGISPIVDQVELMKNSRGQFAVPSIPFSNMDDLTEGQGYQIRVSEDVVLNYPVEQEEVAVAIHHADTHWAEPSATDRNMSVLINSVIGLESVDYQIAAFSTDGYVVGVGTSNRNGVCGLAVWGADESTEQMEGLMDGEAFELRLWDANEEIERNVAVTVKEGSTRFEADAFTVLDLTVASEIPNEYYLTQAYPNPFNATTKLSYGLPEAAHITIQVYDLTGRIVATPVNGEQTAGYHNITWHSGNVSSGMYIIRMESADFKAASKVMLVR